MSPTETSSNTKREIEIEISAEEVARETETLIGKYQKLASIPGETNDGVLLAGTFASILLSDSPIDPLPEALRRPRLADQARHYLIEVAPGRTAAFRRHAQDPDVQIRSGIADVLGLAGDVTALPIVEAMVRDRDPQVAMAAQRAVARLQAIQSAT